MNLLEAANWRYAVRQFSDEILSDETVESLLDLTRLSASSFGLQPYRLIVVKDPAVKQQLLQHSYKQAKVVESSHCVVFAAQKASPEVLVNSYIKRFSETRDVPEADLEGMRSGMLSGLSYKTPEALLEWSHQQAYIALGTLLTNAALMKVDACPMGGFIAKGYDEVLGLEAQGLTASVICVLGKRHPDDKAADAAKVRVEYDEMVVEV